MKAVRAIVCWPAAIALLWASQSAQPSRMSASARQAPPSRMSASARQAGAAAQAGPQTHPVSGRRIANVMGPTAPAWLDRPERESEEAPSKAIAALKLSRRGRWWPTSAPGSGYYSMRLARGGRSARAGLRDRHPARDAGAHQEEDRRRGLSNVELVLGTPTESRLPDGAIDLALMVDVYHELADPQGFLRSLKRALKPGGRLVLIEFRKESAWVPIREEHKMSVREARLELEAEGYRFDRVIDVLPWQHILVFRTVER